MPIYEFYCKKCNTIFNFFSRTVNTTKTPDCPKCETEKLTRQVSLFAFTGKASEQGEMDELPMDESKMERAMEMLARESGHVNEDDPRQAANMMRKLTDATGLQMGHGMEEALRRLEKGEDPERIETEMGDILEQEEPFILAEKKGISKSGAMTAPRTDETLYEL